MSTINSNNVLVVDLSALTADDIQSLDIETALLAVNMNRVSALDDQLRTQMEGVQAKNDQMALLTTLQNNLNAVMNGLPSNMTDTTILGDNLDNQVGLEETVNDSMQAAQVQLFKTSDGEYRIGLLSSGDSYEGGINRNVTKGELDLALNDIQSMLTNLSNTQQTDMLTLQSTTNKRNEAYDTMTNFLKKLQDSKSGIVSNMRS
jgi:hypothetical protein